MLHLRYYRVTIPITPKNLTGLHREINGVQSTVMASSTAHTDLWKKLKTLTKAQNYQKVAREAGVSTRTVQWILDGTYPRNSPTKAGPSPDKCTVRQLRGYVEALTRLAIHAGLDPAETLRSYHIDPKWPGVPAAMERASKRAREPEGALEDSVLAEIERRRNRVRAGILAWEPWILPDDEPKQSWAYRYLNRMIRSIDPDWEIEEIRKLDLIQQVVGSFKSKAERLDLVFGTYDHVFRRRRGLDFIHLPGLGVPLAFLAYGSDEIRWADVLRGSVAGHDLKILVVEHEVGHLFLTGAGSVTAVKVHQRSDIGFLCAKFIEALRDTSSPDRVVFVADLLTCYAIQQALETGTSYVDHTGAPHRVDPPHALVSKIRLVDSPRESFPTYRLGIGVPADALQWKELLVTAQREELFRNAINLTAADYAKLVVRPPGLEPLPLQPDLDPTTARLFAEQFLTQLNLLAPADDVRERFTSAWLDKTAQLHGELDSLKQTISALMEGRLAQPGGRTRKSAREKE